MAINDNTSLRAAGGVFAGGGAVLGNSNGTFEAIRNFAFDGDGGAILSAGTTTVSGSTVTLSNNDATGSGGGIFSQQAVAINGPLVANDNIAGLNGGGILAENGDVTVTSAVSMSGNTATQFNGGAIAALNGSVSLAADGGDVSLTGNTAGNIGGAVFAAGAVFMATAAGNVVIDNNVSAGAAGGVFAGGGAVLGNSGGTFEATGNAANNGDGGAILSAGATLVSGTSVTLSSNQASGSGGGVFSQQALVINGSLAATSNFAGVNGGALYGGAVTTLIGAATFQNNTATDGSGGAVYSVGDLAVDIPGEALIATGNSAGTNGGAFYGGAVTTLVGGTVTLEDNTAASGSGGAVYSVGDVAVGDASGTTTLTGNVAGIDGGAIYGGAATTVTGAELTLEDNTATAGSGGAVFSVGDVAVGAVDGTTTLTGNTAAVNGGAIAGNAVTTVTGATVTLQDNTAQAGSGGAVYSVGNVAVGSISGGSTTVTGNVAFDNGGAIFGGGSATTLLGARLTLQNNTATNGSGGAVYAADTFLLATSATTTISDNSAGAQGGALWVGGNLEMSATADITFIDNAQGTAGTPQANAIYLDNTNGAAIANFATSAGSTITFFDPMQSNAVNGLVTVNKLGTGAIVFDGSHYASAADQWSQVYGNTVVQDGTFVVNNNAVYGVLAADVGQAAPTSFTVDAGATLAGGVIGTVRADNFLLGGTLDIAGTNAGTIGNNFTVVSSNVSFGAGSRVLFNTTLNDASVQLSDLLTLDLNGSATTGTAGIIVTNVGGAGALTIGNGIQLVQANNGTTAGAFVLAAPAVAGPYEYSLFHGSIDGSGPENWYLRSALECTLDPTAPVCFRQETSIYAAIPSLALQYGRTVLDTLHERVGEEEDIRGRTDLHETWPRTGGWARVFGKHGKQDGDSDSISGDGPEYSYDFWGLQAGQDVYRHEDEEGARDHAGFDLAFGQSEGDVSHTETGKGDSDFTAFSLGAYWTHFGPSGWYLDGVGQATWYDVDSSAHRGLQALETDGLGLAASLEGGYPVRFGNGFFIEPQAQAIYQHIDLDQASDGAATIRFEDVESFVGRVGARLGRSWIVDEEGSPQLVTVWLRPNLWHEFLGDSRTEFSSADGFVAFRSDIGGTSAEINVGISDRINESVSIYANASYEAGLDDSSYAYDGKLGVRLNW